MRSQWGGFIDEHRGKIEARRERGKVRGGMLNNIKEGSRTNR